MAYLEQRVTRGIGLSEFDLPRLKVYKVERSISPSIFLIKQRGQPLCGVRLIEAAWWVKKISHEFKNDIV